MIFVSVDSFPWDVGVCAISLRQGLKVAANTVNAKAEIALRRLTHPQPRCVSKSVVLMVRSDSLLVVEPDAKEEGPSFRPQSRDRRNARRCGEFRSPMEVTVVGVTNANFPSCIHAPSRLLDLLLPRIVSVHRVFRLYRGLAENFRQKSVLSGNVVADALPATGGVWGIAVAVVHRYTSSGSPGWANITRRRKRIGEAGRWQ
jgi:hypothetical protein